MQKIKVRIPIVCSAKTGDHVALYDEKAAPEKMIEDARALLDEADEDVFVSWVEALVPVPKQMRYHSVCTDGHTGLMCTCQECVRDGEGRK